MKVKFASEFALENEVKIIEGFEYPSKKSQNPQKSTLNRTKNRGYSKSSIENFEIHKNQLQDTEYLSTVMMF